MSLSQRGNNRVSDLQVAANGFPDVQKFMAARQRALQAQQSKEHPLSLEERKPFIPLRSPANIGKMDSSILDVEELPIKRRTYKIEFEGTLSDWQKAGEAGVQWQTPEVNLSIFQTQNADGDPIGDLSKVIPVAASSSHHRSTLPFDTCVKMPGIEGNIFLQNGIRTPVHIPAGANGLDTTRIECHKLDQQQMRLAELHLTNITKEMLESEFTELPMTAADTVPMVLVKRDGELTRVITRPKNIERLNIDMEEYELVRNNEFYFMEKDLVQLAMNSIMQQQKKVSLPFVNHFKWPVTLLKEDGGHWSDVDCDPSITSVGENLSAHYMQTHHKVSFLFHYDYVIASGPEWERSIAK